MNFLKKLIKPVFTGRYKNSQTFRLYLLRGQYDGKWEMPEANEPEEKKNEFLASHYKTTKYAKQRTEVQDMAHLQMLHLFDKVVYVVYAWSS